MSIIEICGVVSLTCIEILVFLAGYGFKTMLIEFQERKERKESKNVRPNFMTVD